MAKCCLLLVVTLIVLVSGGALSAPAVDSQTKLSKLAPFAVGSVVHAAIDGKPTLRGLKSTENAFTEERGLTELAEKMKTWLQSVKKWIAKSKTLQGLIQKRRASKVSKMMEYNPSHIELYIHKVTPEEYFVAKGLNPNLKFNSDVPRVLAENPGLKDWLAYSKYWNERMAKA